MFYIVYIYIYGGSSIYWVFYVLSLLFVSLLFETQTKSGELQTHLSGLGNG